MADEQEFIGLAEAIALIRAELAKAQHDTDGQRIQFDVGSVEVELGGEIRKEGRQEGQLRFSVLSGGLGRTTGRSATHKIKLTLTPVDTATGQRPIINDHAGTAPRRPRSTR